MEHEVERPLSRDVCVALGMAALLASGVGAFFGHAAGVFMHTFGELGTGVPALAALAHDVGLPASAIAWGVLALGGCLAAPRLPRGAGLGLLVACALGSTLFVVVGVGGFAGAQGLVEGARAQLELGPIPPPAPARAAPLAAEIAAAVRRDVLAARTFVTPAGATRAFFIYDGPGAPAPPAAGAEYADVHAHPACVLLPGGPPGNTDHRAEAISLAPRLVPDLSPAAIDAGAEAITFELGRGRTGAIPRFRATIDAGGGLSFAVSVERERLLGDDAGERTRCGPGDRFSDRLYRVRVFIFSGFDPARAGAAEVARVNQPILALVTEVRR